jgi:molybdopterin-guanine dinucleotide biosynthesis protein A
VELVAGIFVGGKSSRMNGAPKGLLLAPSGVTILQRWQLMFAASKAKCILVGDPCAYAEHMMGGDAALADDPPGIGPLGGLVALLKYAGDARVIAVACDMPFVSSALLTRLIEDPSYAPIVAPRRDGRWEAMFARFDAKRALPIATRHATEGMLSLQKLFDVAASELAIDEREARELRDWDTPEDIDDGR